MIDIKTAPLTLDCVVENELFRVDYLVMKISVITVCFNAAETIAETILSVQRQDYLDIEHIIIDGASTDETIDIVRSMANAKTRFFSESDKGLYDAMNKGISIASGDVIGFINADDFYRKSTVLSKVGFALSSPSVDACYADLYYVKKDAPDVVVRHWNSSVLPEDCFLNSWAPPHPTFYAKKYVYEKYGNFNLNYRTAADFDLMMRFLKVHKISSIYVPEVWVCMRLGGASNHNFKTIINQNLEIVRSLRSAGFSFSLSKFIIRKIIIRLYQYARGL